MILRWRLKVKAFSIREKCRSGLASVKGIVRPKGKRRGNRGSSTGVHVQPTPLVTDGNNLDEHTAQEEATSTVNPTPLGHFIGPRDPPTTPEEPGGQYHVLVAKLPPGELAAGPSVNQPSDHLGNDPHDEDSDSSMYTKDIYIHVAGGGGRKVRRLAKMDTGADVNIMARDVQEAAGYTLEPYSELIKPFESEPIQPLGRVRDVEWRFGGFPKTYKEDFFVLETGLFDTLIGKQCIRRNRLLRLNLSGCDA
ncbi:MAG: hypothetical protein M1813_001354 [Trichoglossum hirsutum]|nr:MAG: hypothetical protein M1813_001354 [Trichoglossum hirsutum]